MALKLNLNEPIQLSLTRLDPKAFAQPGKPPSHMYSVQLPDGTEDKLFLPQSCSATITDLRINTGDLFAICRRKTSEGREYFEIEAPLQRRPAQVAQQAAAPQPVAPRDPGGIPPVAPSSGSASAILSAALIAAIDAASNATRYAQSKGMALEFGPEDIRALAATVYIQGCKDPLYGERMRSAA